MCCRDAEALADHSEEAPDNLERFEEIVQAPEDPAPPPPRRGLGLALARVQAAAGLGQHRDPSMSGVPKTQAPKPAPLDSGRPLLVGEPRFDSPSGANIEYSASPQLSANSQRFPEDARTFNSLEPPQSAKPLHERAGQAILAPHAAGGIGAAAFAPVVLIRPLSPELVQSDQSRTGGGRGAGAQRWGGHDEAHNVTFMPLTVVRPSGEGEREACYRILSGSCASNNRFFFRNPE